MQIEKSSIPEKLSGWEMHGLAYKMRKMLARLCFNRMLFCIEHYSKFNTGSGGLFCLSKYMTFYKKFNVSRVDTCDVIVFYLISA